MKKLNVLLLIPLMLISSLLLVPINVHAMTGTVSVNGGNQVLATGSTVSVPIQIAGSDAYNGFDIQVVADPSVLQATGVDMSGSTLSNPSIVTECIDGVLIAGSTCSSTDGAGVVHLAAASVGGSTSADGVLFSINYNVVGQNTNINFNTGCSGTSVPNTCVTISAGNGSGTALSETAVGASFSVFDFGMSAQFAKVSTPSGVALNDQINYVAFGGYSDILTESVTASAGLTASLAVGVVDLANFDHASDTLTVSASSNGDYTATVTATGTAYSNTHSVTVNVHVGPAGMTISLSQSSVTVPRGTSDSSTVITVNGVSGFSGTVTFSVAVTGSGVSGSAPSVTLTNDGSGYSSGSSTLTVTAAASATVATDTATVTGTSGSKSASASLTVIVPGDIQVFTSPDVEQFFRGRSLVVSITAKSTGTYSGSISLSAAITNQGTDSPGSTTNFVTTFLPGNTVSVSPGGSATVQYTAGTFSVDTSTPTATGNYTLTVTATGGANTATATTSFQVQDWSWGPNYCPGNTDLPATDDGYWGDVFVGSQCNTLTITTTAGGASRGNLWSQVNSLGSWVTHSNGFTAVGVFAPDAYIGTPTNPGRGIFVPELHAARCLNPTYWPNGTLMTPDQIANFGPVTTINFGNGCRFNALAWPHDGDALNLDFNRNLLPDYFSLNARALSHTTPGNYKVQICAAGGENTHCEYITVAVINAPTISSFTNQGSKKLNAQGQAKITFSFTVANPNNQAVYFAVTVDGVSEDGTRTFEVTQLHPTVQSIAANGSSTVSLSYTFGTADAGHTFTYSVSLTVGVLSNGLTANINTSTSGTFTIQPH